jgi:nuclear pore complex protein Nup98-Nup96
MILGTAAENGVVNEQVQPVPTKHASNGSNKDHSLQKADMYKTLGGHRAGEACILYEHEADVEAPMPKLQKSDYLMLPRIHELALSQ